MTKKALIIIAIAILIPIVITLAVVNKYNIDNRVVAEYDGSIEVIVYDGLTLRMVKGDTDYNFRFGEYLGKVGNSMTGASLYRVKDDATGKYYAIADGARRILFTETGELVDGIREENSTVTRVIFDDYLIEEKAPENITLLMAPKGNKVSVDMSNYVDGYKYYDLYLSFDSSAIVTEYFGRLIKLTEKDKWIYISPEDREYAEDEYGDDIESTVYIATLIEKGELDILLDSFFEKNNDKNAETSSAR